MKLYGAGYLLFFQSIAKFILLSFLFQPKCVINLLKYYHLNFGGVFLGHWVCQNVLFYGPGLVFVADLRVLGVKKYHL